MRIWFNSNFGSIHKVFHVIRSVSDAELPAPRFTLLCSHRRSDFAGFVTAHEHFLEPAYDDAYVDWCLTTVRERRVDVLVPFRAAAAIGERRREFEAVGTRVLEVAAPEVLNTLHDKLACHASLAARPDWLARYEPFAGPQGFAAALDTLRSRLPPDARLCVKPASGVYGQGFFVVDESDGRPLPPSMPSATLAELAARYSEQPLAPQLAMEYLPGPEYSVDAIADHGEPVRYVIRHKIAGQRGQSLRHDAAIGEIVEGLVRHFGLNGLFNVQLRRAADGEVKLLEINPRPSGGTAMSCRSGVNLPYWALRGFVEGYAGLAIPEVRDVARVAELTIALELPDA